MIHAIQLKVNPNKQQSNMFNQSIGCVQYTWRHQKTKKKEESVQPKNHLKNEEERLCLDGSSTISLGNTLANQYATYHHFFKKRLLFYGLFLLVGSYQVSAAQSILSHFFSKKKVVVTNLPISKLKKLIDGYADRSLPKEIIAIISRFALPKDLTDQDLTAFDFTGCHFTHTNLTGTILDNVILNDTTCDYLPSFEKRFHEKYRCKLSNAALYGKRELTKELKSIRLYYAELNNHQEKAKLLQIASAFSRLPLYQGVAFRIKW